MFVLITLTLAPAGIAAYFAKVILILGVAVELNPTNTVLNTPVAEPVSI